MQDLRRQLLSTLSSFCFPDDEATYIVHGRIYPCASKYIIRELDEVQRDALLRSCIADHLYSDFYCRPHLQAGEGGRTEYSPTRDTEFEKLLIRANRRRRYSSPRWLVVRASDRWLEVRKGELELTVARAHLTEAASKLEIGDHVSITLPCGYTHISPGHYLTTGGIDLPEVSSWSDCVRFYFNATPRAAVALMRCIPDRLCRRGVPFNLKALSSANSYDRRDSVVLYTRRGDLSQVTSEIAGVVSRMRSGIRPGVPAMTRELCLGLGIAESPQGGESFGLHRCDLLARALLDIRARSVTSNDERVTVVENTFRGAGISLSSPYLNRESRPFEESELSGLTNLPASVNRHFGMCAARPVGENESYRNVASRIGEQILSEAIWHEDRCTWLNVDFEPDLGSYSGFEQTFETMGPSFYSGSSGIAFFLAHLYRETDENAYRIAALAAMKQAMWLAESFEDTGHRGVFLGSLGVAFTGVLVGKLLGSDSLVSESLSLAGLQETCAEGPMRCHDLLNGSAGSVLAFVLLYRLSGERRFLDRGIAAADSLVDRAERCGVGQSWSLPGAGDGLNLTGLSHGAAGAAYALLELYRVTDDPRYRSTAELAIDYEQHWFNSAKANWPDFRGVTSRAHAESARSACSTAWCHGAPGIALSRIRAFEILSREKYAEQASVALHTTRQSIVHWADSDSANLSLCHGLCGNALVLLQGHRLTERHTDEDLALVKVSADLIAAAHSKRHDWRCGVGVEQTSSFMLGLAGIGYFFLCLTSGPIPSIMTASSPRTIRDSVMPQA